MAAMNLLLSIIKFRYRLVQILNNTLLGVYLNLIIEGTADWAGHKRS